MTTEETLAELLTRVRAIETHVREIAKPVERMTVGEAAGVLKKSPATVLKLAQRGVFSDARPPGQQRGGVGRLFLRDEVETYITEGAAGVRRFRRALGRLR